MSNNNKLNTPKITTELAQLDRFNVNLSDKTDEELMSDKNNSVNATGQIVNSMLEYYITESYRYNKMVSCLTKTIMSLNISLIFLNALIVSNDLGTFFNPIVITIPIITTSLTGWLSSNKANEKASKNRLCAERLKSECMSYNSNTGAYAKIRIKQDKIELFMSVFESIKAEERELHKNTKTETDKNNTTGL